MAKFLQKLRAGLGSRRFFWFVIGFFIFQAAWIALSAAYPQAFDEDFHFGLIQAYSHYLFPFLSSPPPHTEAYGAMTRDPSFIYHFLMSFPYRLIQLFTSSLTGTIVVLRLLNVALFTAGLLLFRRVLGRAGLSAAATNVCLFIFTLIPIVPQVAGQINYDNLLMPMVAWACLLSFRIIRELQHNTLRLQSFIVLVTVCLFATLVKYEFAPIFLGIVVFFGAAVFRRFRGRMRSAVSGSISDWAHKISPVWRGITLILLLVASGLFIQRDGVNLLRYHTLAPDCSQVLTIDSCSNYPVWIHDYSSHQLVVNHTTPLTINPLEYIPQWIYWLWYRLFFAVNGPDSSFRNYPPLPLPVACFALLVIAAVVLGIRWRRQLFSDSRYVFLAVVIGLYLLVLLVEGYLKYRATAVLELMNGRYLLPIVLLGAVLGIRAFALTVRNRPQVKTVAAVIAVVLFVEGGGIFTFLSRSDASWNWQNRAVITANNTARKIVEPVIIDGPRYYTTGLWFFN